MSYEYKKPHGVESRLVMMTPKMASDLLAHAATNRNVRTSLVNWLVGQIKRGEWKLINNTIGLGKDGKLYDGQHRLWAVVMSETTVPMWIISGLEEAARSAIDKGTIRNVSDELGMFYNLDYTRARVAFLRLCLSFVTGHSVSVRTTDEYWDLIDDFEGGITWSVECFLKTSAMVPFRQSAVAGALALAHKADPKSIISFGAKLRDGENLAKGSPALLARRVILEETTVQKQRQDMRLDPNVLARYVLRCAYAEIRGESITRMSESDESVRYFTKPYANSKAVKNFTKSSEAPEVVPNHATVNTQQSKERAVEFSRERRG